MRASHTPQTARGFTLLELIVVMTLLALVLAIAAPRLGEFLSGRDAREEARRMLSLVRFARAEAIERGESMRVWFDPATGAYGLRSVFSETVSEFTPIEFSLREGLLFQVTDAAALKDDNQAFILFLPDGSVDADSIDRVELFENGEATLALARLENGTDYIVEEARDAVAR